MSTQTLSSLSARARAGVGSAGRDAALLRFGLGLALTMAGFLVLVVVLGRIAALPFLLVFVPLVVWSAFADTEKAVYVLCAWCWMDGTIRGIFGGSGVAVLGRDIVLLLVVLGWALHRIRTRIEDPLRLPPGLVLLALFVLNALLQVANPESFGLLCSLAGLKQHLSPLPLLLLGYDVFRRREQVRAFFYFLSLATLVIALVSVIQYVQGPGWTYAHFPGTRNIISQDVGTDAASLARTEGFKPPGTTTFGGGVNAYISFVLPMTFVLLLLSRQGRFPARTRWVFVGTLFVFVLALFLNGVRSGLVTAVACVLGCSVLAGGRLMVRTLTATALCLVLAFGAFTYSQGVSGGHVSSRFASTFSDPLKAMHQDRQTFFDQFPDLVARTPLGAGLGKVGPGSGQFGSDPEGDFATVYFSESYLGCMIIETGILGAGLIFALSLYYIAIGLLLQRRIVDPDSRLLSACLLAIFTVIVANFFTTPILFQPPGTILYWLGAALLMRPFAPRPKGTP